MRISFALRNLLAPMLALLLLAGCMAPAVAPLTVRGAEEGSVTISVAMPEFGYQTQHLLEDINSLVFGLVDLSTDASNLYFGFAQGNAISDDAPPNYHAIIAGDGSTGSDLFGPDLSLHDSERKQTKRYLYAAVSGNTRQAVTFANVKPNKDKRYVAFVAAFQKDITQGEIVMRADAIGFKASEPFKVESPGVLSMPPLEMVLDRALGSLKLELKIAEDPASPLSDMDTLVVGLLDATGGTDWNPALGYEISTGGSHGLQPNPLGDSYHVTLLGASSNDPSSFKPGKFNYAGTLIQDTAARGDLKRALYYFRAGDLATLTRPLNLTFSRLKPSAHYYPFAAVFKGGVGDDHLVYFAQATASVPVWPDETPPPNASTLTLRLSN